MRLSKMFIFLPILLLMGCSNSNVLDTLSISVETKETYTIDFYNDITKKEFFLFDSKVSLFEHLNNGNYYVDDLLIKEINNIISDDYFDNNYLSLLNITIGSGTTINVHQKDNLIIYDFYTDKATTDGILFKSIFNSVKKNGLSINEFSFDVTNSYGK